MKCKRCGRELRSKESIERGYGATCYQAFLLNQEASKPHEEYQELKNKWNQLSLKYSSLERKLNKSMAGGIKHNPDADLEWRKKEVQEKKETVMYVNMKFVISELNGRFKLENFGLVSPDGRTEPELPPMIEVTNQMTEEYYSGFVDGSVAGRNEEARTLISEFLEDLKEMKPKPSTSSSYLPTFLASIFWSPEISAAAFYWKKLHRAKYSYYKNIINLC